MRHAVHLIHGKPNAISVCDACAICEELYNRPDAFITYKHSGEITNQKLQEAITRLDRKRTLDSAEIQQLEQEWKDITKQSKSLRIWSENAVLEVPAEYYDQYILENWTILSHRQVMMVF